MNSPLHKLKSSSKTRTTALNKDFLAAGLLSGAAYSSIVFEAPNELYLTTNFYVSKLVTLRTPSNVVDTICFWSFEKSHDITTDSDSVFLNTGAVGLRVSYKQTS
jgi:hypothetical protein